MATVKINVCTDAETKKAAEALFSELGLNMTTAINIFLKRALLERGIPFEVSCNVPNSETLAAIKEGHAMALDPNTPSYDSIEALRGALGV